MKKAILTLALIMSIGATQVSLASSAPKHRYHPTTQQVDKQATSEQASAAQDDEAIAAYSDTTATDTSDYADVDDNDNRAYHSKYSLGNYDDPFDFIGSVFGGGALSVIIIFCIIFGLLFVFAPLIIVFLVIRYLIRRHNDRMKLAEMAMEKGINVPVVPGIMPVTNAAQVKRTISLTGNLVPAKFLSIVDRFGDDPEAMKQAGIAYATEQIIDLIANGVNHIHIYSMNKPDVAGAIMDNLSSIYVRE